MKTTLELLRRLKPLVAIEGYAEAKALLEQPDTRVHVSTRSIPVREIDHAWRIRLSGDRINGRQPLPGCVHLVDALGRLSPDAQLEMWVAEADDRGGGFWFLDSTKDPVGFVAVVPTPGR
jgi:hypothetical protein